MQGQPRSDAGSGNDPQPGYGRSHDAAGNGTDPQESPSGDESLSSDRFAEPSGDRVAEPCGDRVADDAGVAQPSAGMGARRRGPGFAPPQPPVNHQPAGQVPVPGPQLRPPSTKLPAILAAAIIGVVAVVVIVATVAAQHHDAGVAQPKPSPTPSALPSTSSHSIVFNSREGSGRLTVLDHRWSRAGRSAVRSRLRVSVEIHARQGTISYSPRYFETFDDSGTVFQATQPVGGNQRLGDGYLHPGDTVRGNIAFNMRRGDTTLVMSNALQESVTALRIAG
jgi:hypothetical protein